MYRNILKLGTDTIHYHCRSDPDATAADLALRHKCSHFKNIHSFLSALKLGSVSAHAAILATPTPTHASMAEALVQADLAVLVEKPLAVTGEEGWGILKACREMAATGGKGIVMVGHHRRHNAYAIAMKRAIEEGKLGSVVAVNGSELTSFL